MTELLLVLLVLLVPSRYLLAVTAISKQFLIQLRLTLGGTVKESYPKAEHCKQKLPLAEPGSTAPDNRPLIRALIKLLAALGRRGT